MAGGQAYIAELLRGQSNTTHKRTKICATDHRHQVEGHRKETSQFFEVFREGFLAQLERLLTTLQSLPLLNRILHFFDKALLFNSQLFSLSGIDAPTLEWAVIALNLNGCPPISKGCQGYQRLGTGLELAMRPHHGI